MIVHHRRCHYVVKVDAVVVVDNVVEKVAPLLLLLRKPDIWEVWSDKIFAIQSDAGLKDVYMFIKRSFTLSPKKDTN